MLPRMGCCGCGLLWGLSTVGAVDQDQHTGRPSNPSPPHILNFDVISHRERAMKPALSAAALDLRNTLAVLVLHQLV